ncbi:hypothetical protein K402DRAFT_39258 [Aulographum hederae CBS 113979]|uniref:Uncharacterized protein n=1 Tax=Aulographum hederae CBS 113979 TaxID=1176131 RepID=A0A6G1H479_9PEZI|nr:hypothetical protein K402DRAFT_39258 [Aulographum hederae CBS 113979]
MLLRRKLRKQRMKAAVMPQITGFGPNYDQIIRRMGYFSPSIAIPWRAPASWPRILCPSTFFQQRVATTLSTTFCSFCLRPISLLEM